MQLDDYKIKRLMEIMEEELNERLDGDLIVYQMKLRAIRHIWNMLKGFIPNENTTGI